MYEYHPAMLLVSIFVPIPVAIILLYLLVTWPLMRYELNENFLTISCGFIKWEIPYSSILDVTCSDLKPSMVNALSFRWPGYAFGNCIFNEPYSIITMCSSRCMKKITVIKTKDKNYGISPKENQLFLQILQDRIKNINKGN